MPRKYIQEVVNKVQKANKNTRVATQKTVATRVEEVKLRDIKDLKNRYEMLLIGKCANFNVSEFKEHKIYKKLKKS